MLRSQILHLIKLLQNKANLSAELGRSCGVLEARVGRVTCARHLHISNAIRQDDTQDSKTLTENENQLAKDKRSEGIPIDNELRSAATDAAKVLPGDWSKTADTLLARLSARRVATQEDGDTESPPVTSDKPKVSLLETLNVQNRLNVHKSGKEKDFSQDPRLIHGKKEEDAYEIHHYEPVKERSVREMKPFKDLFEVPRLGIFDAEKIKSHVLSVGQRRPVMGKGLWEEKDANRVRLVQGGIPRNAWEEQIAWTRQGKLWAFPIDNEADMHDEREYKFHHHVFLERHLGDDFPASGPIRKFMSLVCLGLSQSPWLTVPEKVEHIRWFVGYFKEKQAVLEASIPGEEGRMPDKEARREVE